MKRVTLGILFVLLIFVLIAVLSHFRQPTLQDRIAQKVLVGKYNDLELWEIYKKHHPSASGLETFDNNTQNANGLAVRNPQFSFRGAYIGDPMTKMENNLDVSRLTKYKNGLVLRRDRSIQREDLSMQAYLGDIPVKFLTWWYLDNKLVGFQVKAKSEVFQQLQDTLIAKYGQPDEIEKGTTQNRMGATFPLVTLTWNTSDGPMILKNPDGNIDELTLFMIQDGIGAELDRRDKELAKQNADKAF